MTPIVLRTILDELISLVNISHPVYIRRINFKRQIASVSFKNNFIRLNKHLADKLNPELLKYILLHELIHLKLGHPYHDKTFYQELNRYLPKSTAWYDSQLRQLLGIQRVILL